MFLVAGKISLLDVFNTGIAIHQFVWVPLVDPQSKECYVSSKEKDREEHRSA